MKIKKVVALVLSAALIVGVTAGGTFAWLIDKSETVTNTFTYGNIDITLDETKVDEDGNPVDSDNDGVDDRTTTGNEYKVVPGKTYTKDPVVTVKAGSEKAVVIIDVKREGGVVTIDGTDYDFDDYILATVDTGFWTAYDDGDDSTELYYAVVDASAKTTDEALAVLVNDEIKVEPNVSKEMIDALTDTNYPTLSVTAYAVQYTATDSVVTDTMTDAEKEAARVAEAWNLATNP